MQSDYSSLKLFLDSLEDIDKKLIDCALTHPSYATENNMSHTESYERLEFLGDAVLKLLASDYLYKKYPEKPEGELSVIRSYIVSDENLSQIAQKIKLPELLKTAENDKSLSNAVSIYACSLEAILGALYLCGKLGALKDFFNFHFSKVIDDVAEKRIMYNPKATLQEYTQKKSKELPVYKIISENGKSHNKIFEISVYYDKELLGTGCGKTKKSAEQNAALEALKKLNLL